MNEELAPTLAKLSTLSAVLNSVSDELAKPIDDLDEYLRKLNLGLNCFVNISDPGSIVKLRIGYANVGRWGLVLSRTEKGITEDWLYNNAPRWLRLRGIRFIPALFDALVLTTQASIKRVEEKNTLLRTMVSIITEEGGR